MPQSGGGIAQAVSIYSLVSLPRKEPVKSRHGHAHCCQLKTESPDKSRFQSSFDPRRIPFKKGDEREDSCDPPRYSVKLVVWFSDYTNLRIKKVQKSSKYKSYSNPKSFVNFLLPNRGFGEGTGLLA